MGSKNELILMMLPLVCAILSAAEPALPPSAFAQQEETSLGEEEGDIAGDMVSNVLNGDNDEENNGVAASGDDGDINRQTAVPIIDQEQRAANLALNEALDVTGVEPRLAPPATTPPPDNGGQEPECSLEITADKETYGPGDTVAITITNTGDVPIEFPDSFLGLEIRNLDSEEVLFLDAQPVVVTFEPGASATFQFTYESLVSEIGAGLISATVPSQCDTVEEVTFTLSAPSPPPEDGDTTPPILIVPDDPVFEARNPEAVQVIYLALARDNVDGGATLMANNELSQDDDIGGDITISCDPPSGSVFAVGTTEVNCTATDEAGNKVTASFTVIVQGTTLPVITVPEDMLAEPTSTEGAQVTYTVTAQDNVDGTATLDEDGTTVTQDDIGGDITISCDPPSGSVFAVGTTEVNCTATDEAGNTAIESFMITVAFTCEGEIATIVGTPGDDTVTGTEERDVIAALGGNDRVFGLGGDDLICGDEGDDPQLFGGDGDDEIFGGEGNDGGRSFTPTGMVGGAGSDHVDGGEGSDFMEADAGDDRMFGQGGDDVMFGETGDDIMDGGAGDDDVIGDQGGDTMNGGAGNDNVFGGSGDDDVNGGAGNDQMRGNEGDDELFGEEGNDSLDSRDNIVNNDSLDGGDGTDTCISDPDPEVNCEA